MSNIYGLAVDDWSAVVFTAHVVGDGHVVLAALNGLPTLPSLRVYRFTAVTNPGTESEAIISVFEATGVTGSTLTGVTASAGYTDTNLAVGVTVQIRICKATVKELQDTADQHTSQITALQGGGGGLGTMSLQNANSVLVTGGEIDNVLIPARNGSFLTANTGTIDFTTSDWRSRVLDGTNGTLVINKFSLQLFALVLVQDGTGSRVVTWFSGITWMTPGGAVPQPSAGAGKYTIFSFKTYGTNLYLGFVTGTNA